MLLYLSFFFESHSHSNIETWIERVLSKYGITQENIDTVVNDKDAKISAIFNDPASIFHNISHVRCIAHTLQLIVNNSISNVKNIKDLTESVSDVVNSFRRSWKRTENLSTYKIF